MFVFGRGILKQDPYTQQPIALLRHAFDYEAWHDRVKLQPRDFQKCQFLSCMNPTPGSFYAATKGMIAARQKSGSF